MLKQGHLEPVAQDHVQMAFENLQGWRLHNLLGLPVPVVSHLCSEKTSCISVFAHCLWSCHRAPLGSAGLHFLCTLLGHVYMH